MSLILAIDPGLTGAYALVERDGTIVKVDDLPVITVGSNKIIDSEILADQWCALIGVRKVTGVIEYAHPMPGNGSRAAFSQGLTWASSVAALRSIEASTEYVTPQSWKRALGLLSKPGMTDTARKRMSIDKARLLFPRAPLDRQKDHGRAEALLIAHWYLQRDSLKAANKLAKDAAKALAKSQAPGTTRDVFAEPRVMATTATTEEPF
jgi:crossover junction endodeoxyribonuclease RuvC